MPLIGQFNSPSAKDKWWRTLIWWRIQPTGLYFALSTDVDTVTVGASNIYKPWGRSCVHRHCQCCQRVGLHLKVHAHNHTLYTLITCSSMACQSDAQWLYEIRLIMVSYFQKIDLRDIEPMSLYCRSTVFDAGPTIASIESIRQICWLVSK